MVRLMVFKYNEKYYLATLGCCAEHEHKSDIFTEGGEEEVFTITRTEGMSSLELLRLFLEQADQHHITEIEVMELYINSRVERALDKSFHLRDNTPHRVH